MRIFKVTPRINLVFIFILLLNFPKERSEKYPQIFEERWRKCIFVSVERESEARLNFLLFFVLLP